MRPAQNVWHFCVFDVELNQQIIPTRERLMGLLPDIQSTAGEAGRELAPVAACGILGMDDDADRLAGGRLLLEHVDSQRNGS